MKPLITILALALAITTTNALARSSCCDDVPNCHDHRRDCREHIKVYYTHPVYCEYAKTPEGLVYSICHKCNSKRCLTEFYYDDDRDSGCCR